MDFIKNTKNKKYQNTIRRRLRYLDQNKATREIGFRGLFVPMYEASGLGIQEIAEPHAEEAVVEIKNTETDEVHPLSKEEIAELGLTGIYNDFRSLITSTEVKAENKELLEKYKRFELTHSDKPRVRLIEDIEKKLEAIREL